MNGRFHLRSLALFFLRGLAPRPLCLSRAQSFTSKSPRTALSLRCAASTFALAAFAVGCGNPDGTVQMPMQGTEHAAEIDWLYYFIFWMSVVAFILIVGTMLWFVVKYRRRPGPQGSANRASHATRALLDVLAAHPARLLVSLGLPGVRARGGSAVGQRTGASLRAAVELELRLPQWRGPPRATSWWFRWVSQSKLTMTSRDVIHSYFIPAFRIKRDTVPGMFTTQWFQTNEVTSGIAESNGEPVTCEPTSNDCPDGYACRYDLTPGVEDPSAYCYQAHQVYCTEYCGAPAGDGNRGHSAMYGNVHVVTRPEYERFLDMLIGPPIECDGLEEDEANVCWGNALYAQNNCAGLCPQRSGRSEPGRNLGARGSS